MTDKDYHPLGRNPRRIHRQLSRDDVGNQARFLLTNFIHDRMQRDGLSDVPTAETLQQPGTPSGPPVDRITEVARALRCIGDELDSDESLQRLISQIPPDAPKQTFMNVAREIFRDGVFNWGRVVALFYFAYKMVVKVILRLSDELPLIRAIIEWVVHFIVDHVASWIIERGGWEAIQEYFGTPSMQAGAVLVTGVIISILYVIWRSRR